MTVTLALPSKGRLKDKTLETLKDAGYQIALADNERNYRATVANDKNIDILFLSASEIARELGYGNVDLGVTGQDLINETLAHPETKVKVEVPLRFGFADVVVAVPAVWHDVVTMADLDDVAAEFRQRHGRRLRIATKFWRLTQQFFSQKHGIQVYRIVESLGATEGAPAAGSADMIVDITSTGETLRANRLKILDDGVILKSQASLVSALRSREKKEVQAIIEKLRHVVDKKI
ncbi:MULTISPECIES: ATP phosphoribosyltransferase [Bartonella]|uniref:ATP phosphoribosyltransferase n=1 Tax=Bartonella choladocola TaxID=2750995 RepID=A0A1U9MFF3_9HYPH|nr:MULTISPECIES: ATP phosphoribosyltransferase [Bartonella]AQT46614.1 ATP phosphoribosyltransferase catalytic subunit [Bartonella choladocola]MBH9974371.1 ATP phosphoribosyltransferase [Bartonella choladocola]MBI0013978.1 ATP phosphoribosyltransferase [Bartonella sp. B10834G3]MBI0139975.1 ATP phosphoribosyltransferase [Bartonella choladocola]